ncbi:hypothetical protein AB0J94_05970 [Micromonospora noduli]|uniref:Uncharacterized protein n=1 Tax=Micromonospora noduli TaxID=709876 RepID=A0ABX9D4Z2_9ACTN|nr:hypothetical protein [Micromonospora noduli]KAB1927690.1 hypothetical protein F8280_05520 [Micromonospora noduli]RAO15086.1 hypothetical protein GUI43_02066 [Micromonospora noduli]RAO16055.1 hypothetical protein LUPAC07_03095 [Micromonospora noduli]RAO21123.1 hypothetical protein MED15_02320 [Micromonospora noduli]RAO29246.1 hypothetical protein ONO23_04588 [Micromonospora noduli]
MTSNDNGRPALFLATSHGDVLDGPAVTFDSSEEAMRQLRHPFAVKPAQPAATTVDASDQRG